MEEMGGQCRGGEVCETRIAGETRSSRAPTPSAAHVCAPAPQCRLVCRLGSALVRTRRAGGHSSAGRAVAEGGATVRPEVELSSTQCSSTSSARFSLQSSLHSPSAAE